MSACARRAGALARAIIARTAPASRDRAVAETAMRALLGASGPTLGSRGREDPLSRSFAREFSKRVGQPRDRDNMENAWIRRAVEARAVEARWMSSSSRERAAETSGNGRGTESGVASSSAVPEQTMEEYQEIPRGAKAAALDAANDGRALKAVHTAIGCNAAILVCKLGAYGVSGSPSMLAESIHSVADIVNQALLQVGITNSNKKPDAVFNYGYRRERFVYSLISAVGIFFLGAGFSVMHGVHGLMDPVPAENLWVALSVLGASAALESFSLKVAYESLRENAKAQNMTLTEFIRSGKDPTSVSVLAEDAAAVIGCGIAGSALLAVQATGNPMFDSMGSIAVGGLLGATALYLINSNRLLLLGRSLGADKMQVITEHMRRDPVVEEVYFAKSEELGAGTYRFAAEVEFSGKKIVERYLAKNKRRRLLHEKFNSASAAMDEKAMDAALAQYGEDIVQAVGDEVDRLEKEIVELEPSIHYVDIETN